MCVLTKRDSFARGLRALSGFFDIILSSNYSNATEASRYLNTAFLIS